MSRARRTLKSLLIYTQMTRISSILNHFIFSACCVCVCKWMECDKNLSRHHQRVKHTLVSQLLVNVMTVDNKVSSANLLSLLFHLDEFNFLLYYTTTLTHSIRIFSCHASTSFYKNNHKFHSFAAWQVSK